MKFVLAQSAAYWWPVSVRMPDPERAGEILEYRMRLKFEPRAQDEERAEMDRIGAIKDPGEQLKAERASLIAVCRDWEEVVTPEGEPVPFSRTNLDAALQMPWFRKAAWAAYWESLAGEKARLGN